MKESPSYGAAIIVSGQVLSVLGHVIGVRLLTDSLSPSVFGEAMLLLGGSLLCVSLGAGPIGQAVVHFYPKYQPALGDYRFAATMMLALRRLSPGPVLLAIGAAVFLIVQGVTAITLASLAILIVVDSIRTVQLAQINARQQHLRHALWLTVEAWLKPLAALVLIQTDVADARSMIAGYALGGALSTLLFADRAVARTFFGSAASSDSDTAARGLLQNVRPYIVPLLPLATVAWVSGLGDRYLIGGLLSLRDAGIYAAAYGLASRPFLMLGSTMELAMRPLYQQDISAGVLTAAKLRFRAWVSRLIVFGGLGLLLIVVFPRLLPDLLLGEEYRAAAASIVPLIAAGYFLLTISQAYERVCYALGRTGYVLAISVAAAIATLVAASIGIYTFGLLGAAIAVPIAFAAQLTLSWNLARSALAAWTAIKRKTVSAS